jgi:hypothetical protein
MIQHLRQEGCIRNIDRMLIVSPDYQFFPTFPTERQVIKAIFGHPVFRSATQAPDDDFIEKSMAASAGGAIVETVLGDAIFGPAVEASDDDIVFRCTHVQPSMPRAIISYLAGKSQQQPTSTKARRLLFPVSSQHYVCFAFTR